MMELLIKGGTVLDPSQNINGRFDLLVKNGQIAAIATAIPATGCLVLDASDKIVIPGLIDLHTHLREPGGEAKETVETGGRAAAAGGFTGITALPNTSPVLDDPRKISELLALAAKSGHVRVWPVGAVTKGSAGRELAELALMHRAGACAFTDDGRGVADAFLARNAMLYCQALGVPFFEHCEDESLAGKGQLHEGVVALKLGLPGITKSAETVMLARDLILARETGCRLHIMHLSCQEGAEMICSAKAAGVSVTAEVTPHHLLLTEEAVDGYNTNAKMKPPLRTAEDTAALCAALAAGTIDAVATDHAPHTECEKTGDFSSAPFGIVGLETAFPLLYTHLVRTGRLSLMQLVDRMSARPAAILGVPGGTLRLGAAADLVIINTTTEWVIDRHAFFSKGKNSPFHGWTVYGVPALTMVGGRIVMKNSRVG